MESRRTIIYTLSFEMKVSFYGAIAEGDVIRTSIAKLFELNAGAGGDSDIKLETITITPNPTTVIGLPDSDFGFDTTIELARDSV